MTASSQPLLDCLIVDDEPGIAWVMEHLLLTGGYTAVSVPTGMAALAALRQQRFRLAFLDAKLPDIDGLQLAQQLRELEPAMPIILVSGYYYPDDPAILRALESDTISHFIAKPFTNGDILAVLAGLA
ncbi:response regulator [Shewanella salipaludis]|uniref:Response regulator n=1 Tax=Shewanella salipaludis TaxID=2723052 RepID=A0A972FVD7_9GAMM|nr:response regulator [Shewanella salipaludis]NMH66461.1 response regulator [Shewanella salipaludis]